MMSNLIGAQDNDSFTAHFEQKMLSLIVDPFIMDFIFGRAELEISLLAVPRRLFCYKSLVILDVIYKNRLE